MTSCDLFSQHVHVTKHPASHTVVLRILPSGGCTTMDACTTALVQMFPNRLNHPIPPQHPRYAEYETSNRRRGQNQR